MALTRLQDTEAIQKDIRELGVELENLRKYYEQYFLGLIREEPSKLREKVKMLVQRNTGVALQNATLKFQLQQMIARYNVFTTYWDRILRQMEEGTYQRDVFKTKLHEKERQKKAEKNKVIQSAPKDEALYKKLFEEYKAVKKSLAQDTNSISFEKFQQTIASKLQSFDPNSQKKLTFKTVKEGKVIKIKLTTKE